MKQVLICMAALLIFIGSLIAIKQRFNQPKGLGSNELMLLSNQGNAQMLSVVLRSDNNGLVVIDGGWEEDGEHLLEVIKNNGGRVRAWLITHPHSDHVGALYYILKNKSNEIAIDHIYYSFAPLAWYEKVSPADKGMVEVLENEFVKLSDDMLCGSIKQGDQITIDNMNITVMNNRYELDSDPVNNSSIVYRIKMNGKTLLFLGDLGYYGGMQLLKDNPPQDLKADIVQMAHHGQNGVDQSVYKVISPEICLWPTPKWLWDNDAGDGPGSGQWLTGQTRQWMKELKVKKNYCIKDGDQIVKVK